MKKKKLKGVGFTGEAETRSEMRFSLTSSFFFYSSSASCSCLSSSQVCFLLLILLFLSLSTEIGVYGFCLSLSLYFSCICTSEAVSSTSLFFVSSHLCSLLWTWCDVCLYFFVLTFLPLPFSSIGLFFFFFLFFMNKQNRVRKGSIDMRGRSHSLPSFTLLLVLKTQPVMLTLLMRFPHQFSSSSSLSLRHASQDPILVGSERIPDFPSDFGLRKMNGEKSWNRKM